MKILRESWVAIRKRSWPEGLALGFIRRLGLSAAFHAQARVVERAGIQFVDRSRGRRSLLVILSGYKPELWPLTFPRIVRFVPRGVDVCIVSSGRRVEWLADFAEEQRWSYLSTRLNELSLVQNAAIERHPAAEFLYKLDEDMFIGEGFFEMMMEGHLKIKADQKHFLGFTAPVINLNGYGYAPFLDGIEQTQEYRARFGAMRQAADRIPVQESPEAARWLWERSLPFDPLARFFANRPFAYSICPHRFSIGAVLFERTFWQGMGGWAVNLVPGGMGYDEVGICNHCMATSQVIGVLHQVFVGHFAFGPQYAAMKAALPELQGGLALPQLAPSLDATTALS